MLSYVPMTNIYKITYPNGKIYIGQNRLNSINYYGSPNEALIYDDFTEDELKDFTITKTILWETTDPISKSELTTMEFKYITTLNSCDPAIGYNRSNSKIPYTYISRMGLFYFRRKVHEKEVRLSLRTRCPEIASKRATTLAMYSADLNNNLTQPQILKHLQNHLTEAIAKNQWEDPEYHKEHIKKLKDKWTDPEYRKSRSDGTKALWKDPKYRKKLRATCSVCGVESSKTAISRWHNDKCKRIKDGG